MAQAVAGDIDLYAFGALGRLDKAMGGGLAESKFYKQGEAIGTPFAVASIFLGGAGLVRGGYATYRALTATSSLEGAVVIGQGMTRVEVAGASLGAETYIGLWRSLNGTLPASVLKAAPKAFDMLPSGIRYAVYGWHNTRWLNSVMDAGRVIIDAGRVAQTVGPSAYNLERQLIAARQYTNVLRFWSEAPFEHAVGALIH